MSNQEHTAERESKYFYLFLAYIFILPLWPNYAELKFSGIPNLAPDRILRFVLFFGFIGIFFTNSEEVRRMKRRLSRHWVLVFALCIFYSARTLSALSSDNTVFEIFSFFRNEFLISFPFFFYALLAIRDSQSINKIMATLVISGIISSLVALVDYYKQKNLFADLVPVTSDYVMGVFLDKTRDAGYRAQGTFEHPIMLGQFFMLLLPIIWVLFRQSTKVVHKIFYVVAAILGLAAVFASGSRAALGLAMAVVCLCIFWDIYAWTRTSRNRVLQYLVISQVPLPILGALFASYAHKDAALGQTQETISSTNARLDMLLGGAPKIFDSLIWGHGLGEALSVFSLVGRAGIRTLDNYYILIGLESGALVLLLYFLILVVPVFSNLLESADVTKNDARLSAAIAVMLLTYSIQMAIHSLSQQIWLVFLVLAFGLILKESPLRGYRKGQSPLKVA